MILGLDALTRVQMLQKGLVTHGLYEGNVRVDQVWTVDWEFMVYWRAV